MHNMQISHEAAGMPEWTVLDRFSSWKVGEALGPYSAQLLVLGGMTYSIGGIAYAARWPDPFPKVSLLHADTCGAPFNDCNVLHNAIVSADIAAQNCTSL